jgi:membrane protein
VLTGIAALVAGGSAGLWLARQAGVGEAYVHVWRWLRWPVTAGAIALSAALAYHLLPNVKQRFRLITPGSVTGTLAWFLTTWAFSAYATHFGDYNVAYGAIGGVIVLMTWFYITAFIFLMGGEMNAILEHAAPDGKTRGARAARDRYRGRTPAARPSSP